MKTFKKSPDEPIARSNEDRFGRKDFSVSLAETLVKVPDSQSITVGLYGSWGSGKTSVINMAVEHIDQKYNEKTVVIKFNPWVFSNSESLHMAFFGTLASKLGARLRSNGEVVAEELKRYGEITGPVGDVVGTFFPPAGLIGKILGSLLKRIGVAHSDKVISVDSTRERVDKILAKSGQRVIVVIDDIDRLDSDEIHQVFKLVKNIAHFSNISYLLSFDREVVADALALRYPNNSDVGDNFIDKIVQLPLYVPNVDQELLNRYLTEELDKIIIGHKFDITDDDMSRFQSVYFSRDAEKLFNTPRRIVRYLNTVDFSIERLSNEASFTDVALVDMLRIFFPELYQRLAKSKEVVLRSGAYGDRDENAKTSTRRKIFGKDEPTGMEVSIVKELFPSVEWALGGSSYGGDFEANWEEAKRVCTDKYFNRYFSYGIPPGDIADSKIEDFLAAITNPKTSPAKASKIFQTLIKDADVAMIISKLRRREKKLPEQTSKTLAEVLVANGASLMRSRQSLLGDTMSPYVQSAILAVHLMKNVDNANETLTKFISNAPINYAAQLLQWVRVNSENDKDKPDFVPLISEDQVHELGKILATRIKTYTKNHHVQTDYPNDVASLMWIWQKWGDSKDIQKYLEESFKKDPKLAIQFLQAYVGHGYEMTTGKPIRSDFRRESYDSIAAAVDPGLFVGPLTKEFGDEVNQAIEYPDGHFNTDKTFEYLVAEQFMYLYRHVEAEKIKKDDGVIEGEVIEIDPTN